MRKGLIWGVMGCLLLCLSACDKGGPTLPSNALNPSAANTGVIAVHSSKLKYFIGETETFTASLSGVPVATGTWSSDTPRVATVNDAGMVTVVGQGWANISCTYAGQTGTRQIWGRVDCRGAWSGTYSIQRCELWGDFPDAGFCRTHGGSGLPVSLALTEEGDLSVWDSLHGTITLGDLSTPVVAKPLLDGSLEMEGEVFSAPYTINVAIGAEYTPSGPRFCMMLYYLYPGERSSGQAMLTCDISLTKTCAGQ